VKTLAQKNLLRRLPGGFIILIAISLAVFLIMSSRLSADEYLLGPVLNGYYVDLKDGFLFTPHSNLFIRYFQGVNAMVRLGWDSYINVVTFQMFPALLANYFGYGAAVFEGAVFILGIGVFSRFMLVKIFKLADNVLRNSSIFFIGLAVGLSVANYNSTRSNFGLFPLTGIRFGLYTFHAWILMAMIFWLVYCTTEDRRIGRRFTLASMLVVGFVSLWYVMYWLAVLVAILFVNLIHPSFKARNNRLSIFWTLLLTLASLYVLTGLFGGPLRRTTFGSKSTSEVLQTFVSDTLLKFDSRLYTHEVWTLVFGRHVLIGVAIGLIISLCSWTKLGKVSETTIVFVSTMSGLCIFLPIIFVFQEYTAYVAWWHRTTPIVLSFTTSVFLTTVLTASIKQKDFKSKGLAVAALAVSSMVLVSAAPEFRSNLRTVNDFRNSWDRGDPFGRSSPIFNYEIWNIKNFMHLKPFRHPTWKPPMLLIESVPTELVTGDGSPLALGILTESATLNGKISPFDVELGNQLEYRVQIRFTKSIPYKIHTVRIFDGEGTRELLIVGDQLTTISGTVRQPGAVKIEVDAECVAPLSQEPTASGCFVVVSHLHDFTQKFRSDWGIS
jgi:hypothetical protein